jgi:hypothetical protein
VLAVTATNADDLTSMTAQAIKLGYTIVEMDTRPLDDDDDDKEGGGA